MMSLSLLPLEHQRTLAELLNHSLTSREELLARAIATCHEVWAAAPTVEAEPPPAAASSADLVASVAHEVNRAYCAFLFDYSQLPWADASDGIKASARSGVEFHLANPDAGPDASHNAWMAHKVAAGWVFGPVKDEAAKTHPCIVPFEELPPEQQVKDHLFRAVVHALAPALGLQFAAASQEQSEVVAVTSEQTAGVLAGAAQGA